MAESKKYLDMKELVEQIVKLQKTDFQKPAQLDKLLDMPPASLEVQLQHAWDRKDRSGNIYIKDDNLTFYRKKVSNSTDCIRGKVGYTRGLHVWEIYWPRDQRGTHAVVGVATEYAPLFSFEIESLVGSSRESWGWDLGRNTLYHDSKNRPGETYPNILRSKKLLAVPDSLKVVLDMDEGTLSFIVDEQYLGVAFRGLKGKKLYPIVSAVFGNCEVTMRYINGLDGLRTPENWKIALCKIIDELEHEEYKRMLMFLNDTLPTVKKEKDRAEMPAVIISYYGEEKSVTVIQEVLKKIPRNDDKMLNLLKPFAL
ncbi:protein gustavus [Amia ocellicauda]|uniref:protein gustavus n=1 Tax=Amia ocellicauda TaxID=2972642 RepID=UPI003464A305